jgi:DNA-binding NtrC family response regulator
MQGGPGLPKKLLLVVDDDIRSTRMLAKMLREDGYRVEVASDGAAAIGRLGRTPAPDALVTAFRMAPVDGVAVARYARSISEAMTIVVVTGYPQVASAKVASLDASVLPKPVDYRQLERVVARGTTSDVPSPARSVQ